MLLHLLALLLPAVAWPNDEQATVVAPTSALLDEPPPPEARPPVRLLVPSVLVTLKPGDESKFYMDVDLGFLEEGWVDLPVTGGLPALKEATFDGHAAALPVREDGWRHLVIRSGEGRHRLHLEGTIESPRHELTLPLPIAARTRLVFSAPDLQAEVAGAVSLEKGAFVLPPTQNMVLSWHSLLAPSPKPVVIRAQAVTALSVDDGGVEGRALVHYQVSNGKVSTLSLRIGAPVEGLAIEGPAVSSFEQQGDRVLVHLVEASEGHLTIDVAFRALPPTSATRPAPLVVPLDISDPQGWVTVTRTEESMLVPEPGAGLQPVASRALPDEAKGLVAGTPLASWKATGRDPQLDWRLLDLALVDTPPTLVDEARYAVALTSHGNLLFKASYQVRNDRRQYLRVVPPEGCRPLGVRVAGKVAQPVADGRGGIFVPLEKSLESMEGLISFPVEVYFLGRQSAWKTGRGSRELQSPSVDAPVAYARWEVLLPPGVQGTFEEGSASPVRVWTGNEKGLSYGRSYGTTLPEQGSARTQAPSSAEENRKEDAAQEYFNQAYDAYKQNRFDSSQALLDRALKEDPTHAASQALNRNLQVILGNQQSSKDDDAQARRVRDLARARTTDQQLEAEATLAKAEQLTRSGDLKAAEEAWSKVYTLNEELGRVEQKESVEAEEAQKKAKAAFAEVKKEEERQKLANTPSIEKKARKREVVELQETRAAVVDSDAQPDDGGTTEKLGGLGTKGTGAGGGGFGDVDAAEDKSAGTGRGSMGGALIGGEDIEGTLVEPDVTVEESEIAEAPAPVMEEPPPPPPPTPVIATTTTCSTAHLAAPAPEAAPSKVAAPEGRMGAKTPYSPPAKPIRALPGVTASRLVVNLPEAGESLRFEQRLVPAGQPITVTIRYHLSARSPQ
jgi:tetratricopeptide (TPR) repeat protein